MKGKLEIGQPALIISCQSPANSWVIGKIVTVEALLYKGEYPPEQFVKPEYVPFFGPATLDLAICSGITFSPAYIDNHTAIRMQDLMPLPPLDEKELAKDKELELA